VNPSTVHLLATLIRHNRGIVTAFEKWVAAQPASELSVEFVQVLAVQRGILSVCEQQLSQHHVDQVVSSR
jgi:hypothetical protein